ncbi:MAG: 6,7-dimethyl-8-ribityllumazine synthase [Alphaproteobacteria bacterium]
MSAGAGAVKRRVLIVEAPFYTDIAQGLLRGALGVLEPDHDVEQLSVAGALEIPGAIAMAAVAGGYDGFLALGCVIRGETYHFEIVAGESARGLMDLTMREYLAIGNGILTVENREQALARAREKDKGGEAAKALVGMMELRHRFLGVPA